MIDITVVLSAAKLKRASEAAYVVFRNNPTSENAIAWTVATKQYKDFCEKTISALVEEREGSGATKEEILANIKAYQYCAQCGKQLIWLYSDKSYDQNYVASIEFLKDFPGWCYHCLLEHCTSHECEGCAISSNPANCSFAEVKKLHM